MARKVKNGWHLNTLNQELVERLYEQGKGVPTIARELLVGQSIVYRTLKIINVKMRPFKNSRTKSGHCHCGKESHKVYYYKGSLCKFHYNQQVARRAMRYKEKKNEARNSISNSIRDSVCVREDQ